jgi:hypothetical protein
MFISLNLFDLEINPKYSHDYFKKLLLEGLNVILDPDNLIFFNLNDSNNNQKVILNIEKIESCPLPIDEYLNRRKNCSIEEQVSNFKTIISSKINLHFIYYH